MLHRLRPGQIDTHQLQGIQWVQRAPRFQKAQIAIAHPLLPVQKSSGDGVGTRDPRSVLVDVVVGIQVRVYGPGYPQPLPISFHPFPVGFADEVGHEIDHAVRVQAFPPFQPLVGLQLEPRQARHDQEVSVEVGHGLLDHPDLEERIGLGIQEVRPDHGLVKGGGHLCHEDGVPAVDDGLAPPREVGVHGMAELVGQGAETEEAVHVVHQDERVGARGSRRKGSRRLSLAGIHIHPPLLKASAPHHLHILFTQWRHCGTDPVHRLFVGNLPRIRRQRRPYVVGPQMVHPQRLALNLPVPMPGGQIGAEHRDEVVEHLGSDGVLEEGCLEGRGVPPGPHLEDILFDGGHKARGQRVLERQVCVDVAFPRGPARLPIRSV